MDEIVGELADREAIREVITRYARGIDRHDDELMFSAYHQDALDDHGTYIGGVHGLVAHCNAVHNANWTTHQHFALNQTIDLAGDTAHVETYFQIALRRSGGTVDLVGGRWLDRMERRTGRWAIAARVVVVDWNAELPAPATPMDAGLFIGGTWGRDDLSYNRPLEVTRAACAVESHSRTNSESSAVFCGGFDPDDEASR
jgi:ketosteroid isomerase-like protein